MGCESCYCNMYMQHREGCLYMFKDTHKVFSSECPCLDCLVQIICKDRYNICEKFHNFLNDNMIVATPEAKKYSISKKTF
jgi:hypothetical protein